MQGKLLTGAKQRLPRPTVDVFCTFGYNHIYWRREFPKRKMGMIEFRVQIGAFYATLLLWI